MYLNLFLRSTSKPLWLSSHFERWFKKCNSNFFVIKMAFPMTFVGKFYDKRPLLFHEQSHYQWALLKIKFRFITVRNSSCGKVMFSQACVKNFVQGGVSQHTLGQTPPRPLQRTVRILLECFLVSNLFKSLLTLRY